MEPTVSLAPWQFYLLLILASYSVIQFLIRRVLQPLVYLRTRHTERLLGEELEFGLPAFALANREL